MLLIAICVHLNIGRGYTTVEIGLEVHLWKTQFVAKEHCTNVKRFFLKNGLGRELSSQLHIKSKIARRKQLEWNSLITLKEVFSPKTVKHICLAFAFFGNDVRIRNKVSLLVTQRAM